MRRPKHQLIAKCRRCIVALLHEEKGQSTTEFVLVFCALLAMVIAFIAFFQAGTDGVFVRLGTEAASHTSGISILGMVQDALLY